MNRRIFFISSTIIKELFTGKKSKPAIGRSISRFSACTEQVPARRMQDGMPPHEVYLSWQTEAEKNTAHFELYRSVNGKDFQMIERFLAAQFSGKKQEYYTFDAELGYFSGKLYYRLKLIYGDGREELSTMVIVDSRNVVAPQSGDRSFTSVHR